MRPSLVLRMNWRVSNVCEANVYILDKQGNEQLLLESVDKIIPSGEHIFLENIYSERKTIRGRIKTMELVEHKVILEKY